MRSRTHDETGAREEVSFPFRACFLLFCLNFFRFRHRQCRRDHFVHVIVLVLSEPSPENDILLLRRQAQILLIQRGIALVIDRIIRLVTALPLLGYSLVITVSG